MYRFKKKQLLLFALTFFISSNTSAQLRSNVDERFELTSIVFRLAGAEEYINDNVPGYAKDIDEYFEQYTDHPLIEYIRFLRNEYEVAYNAVPASARLLTIKNGSVRIAPNANIDKFLREEPRFTKSTLLTYFDLLNRFYADSQFNKFFLSHSELYNEAIEKFDLSLQKLDTSWFERFYGTPFKDHKIYISIPNGPSNYSLESDLDGDNGHAILVGCFIDDGEGGIELNNKVLETIIHELCHDYTNHLVERFLDKMTDAGNKIFPYVEDMLERVAYGDAETMLYEVFVNLFTLMYFREESPEVEKYDLYLSGYYQHYGFIWIDRMVEYMNYFYQNREVYPHIDSFMPELAGLMNHFADNIEIIFQEYQNRNPYVLYSFPLTGSVVTGDIREIEIVFSADMHDLSGLMTMEGGGVEFPELEIPPIWKNSRTLIFAVEKPLTSGSVYGLRLPYNFYQSDRGHEMKKDYTLIFKYDGEAENQLE